MNPTEQKCELLHVLTLIEHAAQQARIAKCAGDEEVKLAAQGPRLVLAGPDGKAQKATDHGKNAALLYAAAERHVGNMFQLMDRLAALDPDKQPALSSGS